MFGLFNELDDNVDRIIRKIDKLYLEACNYLESLVYVKSIGIELEEDLDSIK